MSVPLAAQQLAAARRVATTKNVTGKARGFLVSWHYAQFSSAILPSSTFRTTQSVSRR